MPAQERDAEPIMDADLEDWGRRIQQEAVPERLRVLAAQLREALSQRRAAGRDRLDG